MQFEGIGKETLLSTIKQKGNDIDLIFTGTYMKLPEKEWSKIRTHYLQVAIPTLLRKENISYTHEEQRMN